MKKIEVGIGFATGRKSFQKVLRTYINNWKESGLVGNIEISLNLFVAYDLTYNKTEVRDYTNIHPEILDQIDSVTFISSKDITSEIDQLIEDKVLIDQAEGKIFSHGYAGKRNAVLYFALKKGMDYLIFLDDDEYPVSVTNTRKTAVWGGQHVLETHLKNIKDVDITHGHHCGYISPIPHLDYNKIMEESDFRMFIEAISNDILNWDNVKRVMDDGGVTYADTKILTSDGPYEVLEVNHAKFISGSNLCLNLTQPQRTFAFYNPPGARGEDTFLSLFLAEREVLKVPCYTFHDGFSTYNCLMDGVLPIRLKFIKADNDKIIQRFYKACIGWIRYKPLLLYITDPEHYDEKINMIENKLNQTLPKICAYFNTDEFYNISKDFHKYQHNVKKHYKELLNNQEIWQRLMNNIKNS